MSLNPSSQTIMANDWIIHGLRVMVADLQTSYSAVALPMMLLMVINGGLKPCKGFELVYISQRWKH